MRQQEIAGSPGKSACTAETSCGVLPPSRVHWRGDIEIPVLLWRELPRFLQIAEGPQSALESEGCLGLQLVQQPGKQHELLREPLFTLLLCSGTAACIKLV